MMMPANFSAIAESEMTYVVGGASLVEALGAVTAPIWNAANVKTFNTNLITIVGNSYVTKVLDATLGTVFGGTYLVKSGEGDDAKRNTIFGKNKALWKALDPTPNGTTNGFNKFLQGVGALAAVYTLGTSTTKSFVAENIIGKDGKAL